MAGVGKFVKPPAYQNLRASTVCGAAAEWTTRLPNRVDAVEKVRSTPPARAFGACLESILLGKACKIVFQQHRPNSEVIFDFEYVRFDTDSGNPRPPALGSNATISPSDHFTLPSPRDAA